MQWPPVESDLLQLKFVISQYKVHHLVEFFRQEVVIGTYEF